MQAWRNHHRECLRQSLQRLRNRPVGAWATILVLAVVLALPALILSLSAHMERIGGSWLSDTAQMDLFIPNNADPADREALQRQLTEDIRIDALTVIPPEQGLEELGEQLNLGRLESVTDNPLPFVIHIQLAGNSLEIRQSILDDYQDHNLIEHITDGAEWTQRLEQLQMLTSQLGWWLMSLLGMAALFVVGNTLRLELHERRRELALISLIGGTRRYLLRPVLYDGVVTGLAGGLVAAILVAILFRTIAVPMQDFAQSYGTSMPGFVDIKTLFAVIGIATLLGWLSAQLIGRFYIKRLARV